MMLKAVFFDMGGTIDTFWFSREQRVRDVSLIRESLSRTGININKSDIQIADMITRGASAYLKWNMESHIELKPAEIWSRYFLKDVSVSVKTLEPIAEELAFIYETRLFVRKMRPEIPAVLTAIHSMGYRIGCISNTQSLTQVPHNMTEYGIIQFFDPIVLSSEYGRRKPDPAIFYYAARLAGVPTSGCIYIGDKINRDILGAQRAGFRAAIQIKHEYDSGEPDEGALPDAVIQDMTELLPILETIREQDQRGSGSHAGRKIKAVFFDAGDILYHRPQKDQHLNRFLEGKKLNPHPDFEAEKSRLRDMAFSGQIRRHHYYEQVLCLYGITDPLEVAAGMNAMRMDDNSVEIIDGAPETINDLKARGFLLGIITDTALSISRKLNWFDQYGFGRVWDCVISSKEIGARKPSPAMYINALTQTGVDACEAVFVGHKKSELDGARAVGLKTIALNYEPGTKADIFIHDIRDLLQVALLKE